MPLDGTTFPTTEVIFGAIERLERWGWCQGRTINGTERCVFGAIRTAASGNEKLMKAALWRVADANPEITPVGIAYWNDEPGRTKDQVIEALRRAL